MSRALDQARQARMQILDTIEACMPAPRPELKPHAPRITVLKIDPEKIGAVIGPGGKVIRAIQEETGVRIDIEDDGSVFIAATDGVVHISQLDSERVERVEDVVHVGDEITVMVIHIDEGGKIRLSRQAVLEGWTAEEAMERDRRPARRPGGPGPSGGRPGGRGRGDGGSRDRRRS